MPEKVYPTTKHAVVLCLIWVVLSLVSGFVVGVIFELGGVDSDSFLRGSIDIIAAILCCCLVLSFGWKRTKRTFRQVFKFNPMPVIRWISIIILSLGATILSSELYNLFCSVLPMPEFLVDLFGMMARQPLVLALMSIVVLPSLAEEMMFRGLILDGLSRNCSEKKAIFISALLFGIIHLNPWQFIGGFVFGLVMAWLVLKSRSLYPGIIVHFVHNLTVLLAVRYRSLVPIQGFHAIESDVTSFQPLWFNVLGMVLFGVGIMMFRKTLSPGILPDQESGIQGQSALEGREPPCV